MPAAFTPEISDRICRHMNEDHADAIVLYVQAFGKTPSATSARMETIDAQGMNITAQVNGEPLPIRIPFDHELINAEDAHHTLIAMVKQAKSQQ